MWAQIAGGGAAAPKQEIVAISDAKSTCVVDANAIIAGVRVEKLGERIVTVPEVRAAEPPRCLVHDRGRHRRRCDSVHRARWGTVGRGKRRRCATRAPGCPAASTLPPSDCAPGGPRGPSRHGPGSREGGCGATPAAGPATGATPPPRDPPRAVALAAPRPPDRPPARPPAPQVLDEVRDRHSRAFLDTLPFGVDLMEPSDESTAAVRQFAIATGDIYSLSAADLRLLSLCRTLEAAAHGTAHLRTRPARRHERTRHQVRNMPGWGQVDNPEEWAEVEAAEADSSAPGAASRIQASAVALDGSAVRPRADPASLPGWGDGEGDGGEGGAEAAGPRRGGPWGPVAGEGDSGEDEEGAGGDEAGGDEGDGEWEKVRTVRARRRRQRKTIRRQMAEEDAEEEERRRERAAALGAGSRGPSEAGSGGEGSGGSEGADYEGEEEEEELTPLEGESSVCIATADFAMQNVLLQMGLRLVAPDGMRIRELARYVLRCHACFMVVRDMNRIFCPKCGNKALDKVQVSVDADGTEHVGSRRRHVLRGAKFSLPMPRGGRHGNKKNPILREDDKRLLKHMARSRKKQQDTDAFAPEFTLDSWHHMTGGGPAKGLEHLVNPGKQNPNERRQARTNRRRK